MHKKIFQTVLLTTVLVVSTAAQADEERDNGRTTGVTRTLTWVEEADAVGAWAAQVSEAKDIIWQQAWMLPFVKDLLPSLQFFQVSSLPSPWFAPFLDCVTRRATPSRTIEQWRTGEISFDGAPWLKFSLILWNKQQERCDPNCRQDITFGDNASARWAGEEGGEGRLRSLCLDVWGRDGWHGMVTVIHDPAKNPDRIRRGIQ